jgi:hypothetical protein
LSGGRRKHIAELSRDVLDVLAGDYDCRAAHLAVCGDGEDRRHNQDESGGGRGQPVPNRQWSHRLRLGSGVRRMAEGDHRQRVRRGYCRVSGAP